MSFHILIDSDHAGDKVTRRSQTGVLIFINKAPILWFSKKKNSVQTSTFGSEFTAMNQAVEMTQAICYKLRIFGIRLTGPTIVYGGNKSVYKNFSIPESVLNKKHHSVYYHACRESVSSELIRFAKEGTMTNLADLFTNIMPKVFRKRILDMLMS